MGKRERGEADREEGGEKERERDTRAQRDRRGGRGKKERVSRVAATGDRAALRRRYTRLPAIEACWPLMSPGSARPCATATCSARHKGGHVTGAAAHCACTRTAHARNVSTPLCDYPPSSRRCTRSFSFFPSFRASFGRNNQKR